MFHSQFESIPKKSIRPSAYESQKSIPKKKIRPSAYESQKLIPKKAIRPSAYASQKRAETNKQPSASSKATQKRAETQKRPLALDSEKRAGSEKRANTQKARKKQSALISVQQEGLVGSVNESDAVHWVRHAEDPSSSTCGRCLYIRNKAELWREHPWLSPRPKFMGGDWALGCDVCSWRYKSPERENHTGKCAGSKLRASTFAAFKFVCHISGRTLRIRVQAHSVHAGHRIAILASHRASKVLPACTAIDLHDRPPVTDARSTGPLAETISRPLAEINLEAKTKTLIAEASTTILDDSRVLKGNVPQCDDWLSAWAESTEQISFRKQCRLSEKKTAGNPDMYSICVGFAGSKLESWRRHTARFSANVLAKHSLFLFRWMIDSIKRSCASDAMLHGSLTSIQVSSA